MPSPQCTGPHQAGAGHPRVREYVALKRGRSSARRDAVALEGTWLIRHATDASIAIDVIFVCPSAVRGPDGRHLVEELRARGTPVFEVSERVLRRMVDRDGPDGLAAIARVRPWRLRDLRPDTYASVVVADGVDLPGNLGTIVRTADGAGAAAVIATDLRIRVTHPVVLKASMGTALSLPVASVDRATAFTWLRRHGFRVVAADPAANLAYTEASLEPRVAIVVGNERGGLAPFWREAADVLVSIPMLGAGDSLNVGHAAALLLYETLRRRR